MPKRGFLPNEETREEIFKKYDSNPDFYENKLQSQIKDRIAEAKKHFAENLAKLSPDKVYTQENLEVHFNFRMGDEGLDQMLGPHFKGKSDPKTGTFFGYKLKTGILKKKVNQKTPEEPSNVPKTIPLEKLKESQRDLYLFLLEKNPLGESLHVDSINFPPNSRYGFGRKVAFLEMLCKFKPPLTRDDGRFNYTLLKDE